MNPTQEDDNPQPPPYRRIRLEQVAAFGGIVIIVALFAIVLIPSWTLPAIALIVITLVIMLAALTIKRFEQVLRRFLGAGVQVATIDPQETIYILEGTPHYRFIREKREDGSDTLHYYVELEGYQFEVQGEFWQRMARQDGDVRLRYLKASERLPETLVSIQPLDETAPPSDSRLQRVIGVGDDGELVYSDDLYDVPDGEIVEIRRKPML